MDFKEDPPFWERYGGPAKRSRPRQEFDNDRAVDVRQRGETLPAYRCWLAYLEHGSIRKAAKALDKNRKTLERYSRRWRWPERKATILRNHARQRADLLEYEERHSLHEAARDAEELLDREQDAFVELAPKLQAELMASLRELSDYPHSV
jgi:hypothetical protein